MTDNNTKRKIRNQKNLKNRIDFKSITKYFAYGYVFYIAIMTFYLDVTVDSFTYHDIVIIAFPLALFVLAIIFLIERDEQIQAYNLEMQKEINKIKDLYKTRKSAERSF